MLFETLLLLLSAQLGLALINFPINRLIIPGPSSAGSSASLAGPLSSGDHEPDDGLSLGAYSADTDDDELELLLTDQKTWFTINVTFGTGPEDEDEDLWIMESGCPSERCNWTEAEGAPSGYTLSPTGTNTSIPWDQYFGKKKTGQNNVTGFNVHDKMSLGGPEDAIDITFSVANNIQGIPMGPNLQGVFPIGPGEFWQDFYQSIPGGRFLNDHQGKPSRGILPATPQGDVNVSITIGGKTFVMDYSSLLNTDTNLIPRDNPDHRYGTLLNSPVGDSRNQWVFGASFLEHVYVSFNPPSRSVCIWPLSDADKGKSAVSPPQNEDGQPVQSPTSPWGETPEKTEEPIVSEETPTDATESSPVESTASGNEVTDSLSTDAPAQAPDLPTVTTTWNPSYIVTSTRRIVGHMTLDFPSATVSTVWLPVEVTVTPILTVDEPSETAPPSSEDPQMTAWESNPAQSGGQNENPAASDESSWVDPSETPSDSLSTDQPVESNTEENPVQEAAEENTGNEGSYVDDGGSGSDEGNVDNGGGGDETSST
ncbi:hypothetical protein QFC22_002565 [Naganishia vaughanmartiniae]|uniref:Uncharacterized protein n=1 Tax=Naganishia vaughanmartiniae TaxID=1424756 RepID=A0ACC2XAH8_9TREE|nr:hypothetical protein QFC22_002565 [Naganishia vaughanmartiniae]